MLLVPLEYNHDHRYYADDGAHQAAKAGQNICEILPSPHDFSGVVVSFHLDYSCEVCVSKQLQIGRKALAEKCGRVHLCAVSE